MFSGCSNAHPSADRGLVRRVCLAFCGVLVAAMSLRAEVLPAGFTRQEVGGAWNEAVGLMFAADNRMFVWERGGRVWIVGTNGVKLPQPMLDISDEVGGWRDYGMLGVALHPNFLNNGYIYLMYVVDHHHLAYHGTPGYSPVTNEYFMASIGRITRYTARAADNFETVDYSSRLVLLGESASNGIPILHQSHGVGTLLFGQDGSLIASCGDGASYSGMDTGGAVHGSYAVQALAEGIIQPKEDVGALRSQLVDCLSGKILRLDPATGNGLPSNPFYDPLAPRAPRSRVWALGLRNPFRMALRPGSGSHDPADGDPGSLYIGDVGWGTWEDLNVCTGPAKNFGWPLYEGMMAEPEYSVAEVFNLDAPNPVYGSNGCTQQYFSFRDLLRQDTLNPASWPNPCDGAVQIPGSLPRFLHTRPVADWHHGTAQARTGGYDAGGNAIVYDLDATNSPVPGPNFAGNSSTGGTWYGGDDFPEQYRNTYFHGDYGQQWIRNFVFDPQDNLLLVRDFMTEGGGVVFIGTHPVEGGLYYIEWGTKLWRITYASGANQPPLALATASPSFGPAPLDVVFSAAQSSDPDGTIVAHTWDFGDGSMPTNGVSPSHTFLSAGGAPTNFTVTLVVQDDGGAFATNTVPVNVNNSPPVVAITSPTNGTRYPLTGDTVYALEASVTDAEHDANQLAYSWTTYLHHNEHTHSEPVDTNVSTSTLVSPVGCGEETYFYRVELIVTDALGLSGADTVFLYPDCPPPTAPSNLVATAVSGSSIALAWSDASATEVGFRIERSYDGVTFVAVATNPPNQTTYLDLGLRSGTLHHYRVVAFADFGGTSSAVEASATTGAGGVPAFQQDPGVEGLVVMEAEDFDAHVAVGAHAWVTNLTAGYTGGAAMESAPNLGSGFNTGYSSTSPRLDFVVNFTTTGTHYVWVRGNGPTGNDDSCHAGLDGAEIVTSDRISSFGTGWNWSRTTMDASAPATFVVATPGLHTVNLWMREDGLIVDRLLLTTSPAFIPAGAGPVSSIRSQPSVPPVISGIPNQSIVEDTSTGPIPFTVQDNETFPENLLLFVTSSNTNLVDAANIELGGAGSNRTLTITPAANQHGETTITVAVNDGYSGTNISFVLTVTPGVPLALKWLGWDTNNLPLLSISGAPSQSYRIQTSADVRQWSDLLVISNQTGTVEFSDSNVPTLQPRFYRAVLIP